MFDNETDLPEMDETELPDIDSSTDEDEFEQEPEGVIIQRWTWLE